MKKLSQFDGYFYPKSKNEIKKYINIFNQKSYKTNIKNIKAIISPHAGYIYSGSVANAVFHLASKQKYKRIVVFGPSHKISFDGASISTYESYQTPLGDLKVDEEFVEILKDKFDFTGFHPDCHNEHSTETQMPFIAHYFDDVQIVEIVYGKLDPLKLSKLVDFILKEDETLLVISTDLSHFHNLKSANKIDNATVEAIKNLDINALKQGEACGIVGVEALLHASKESHLQVEIKEYKTSYERNKDESSVVGYVSAIFGRYLDETLA